MATRLEANRGARAGRENAAEVSSFAPNHSYARDCELWLGKNYKAEYHVVDELRGAPTLSNSALADRTPPARL